MKLLSDMLEQENSETGQGEREIMADLFQVENLAFLLKIPQHCKKRPFFN